MSKLIITICCLFLLGCNPKADLKHDIQVLRFQYAWSLGYAAGVNSCIQEKNFDAEEWLRKDSIEFEKYLKEHE